MPERRLLLCGRYLQDAEQPLHSQTPSRPIASWRQVSISEVRRSNPQDLERIVLSLSQHCCRRNCPYGLLLTLVSAQISPFTIKRPASHTSNVDVIDLIGPPSRLPGSRSSLSAELLSPPESSL